MEPRLIPISGPLRGTVFKLSEDDINIGRLATNQIRILDGAVSRRHCALKRAGEVFTIEDLESRNGTFVNGVPVKERMLEHGDRIEVGGSTFIFLIREGEPPLPSNPVQLEDTDSLTAGMVRLKREDAVYTMTQPVMPAAAPALRKARDLDALLRISSVVNSIRALEDLERRLLELIFEVIPADRGAILLVGEGPDEFRSIFGLDKNPANDRPVQVSRTIIRQVVQEATGVLVPDLLESDFQGASLVGSRISSLLAVPLLLFDKVIGVVYLDTASIATRFDDGQLQLLTGIASLAAVALENARDFESLATEKKRLQEEITIQHNMVGESAPMREVLRFVGKAAPTNSTVLIRGESGVGKELVARAIHANSRRAEKPFVAINCAAVPETLLEAELFGHERGAFTGAVAQKKGKVEIADGGTLFLDEISEMSPLLQAKLLRMIQEREIERLGGTRPIRVDIRLIAATNKDLETAIREGTFRQDLYFRLNVVSVVIPPLRERRDDISLLATHFVKKYSRECNKHDLGISAEARALLMRYEWPGNIRELENAVERAVVLGSEDLIRPEDLPEDILEAHAAKGAVPSTHYHETIKEAKKKLILQVLDQSDRNFTEAARLLGVHPNYLHRLVRNLGLREECKK